MGDREAIAKGRQELANLYLGVPDKSVDLSFKDLASFQHNDGAVKRNACMTPIYEEPSKKVKEKGTTLCNSPSLDFSKAFQATRESFQHIEDELNYRISATNSIKKKKKPLMVLIDDGEVGGDASATNVVEDKGGGGRRRPGIPHSNICSFCNAYVYIFRHRCLVCGRLYCRECVLTGMGDMSEGRKCIECLGRRFSERYIHRAGQTGCWCWKYPAKVREQELKWAEKGPRKSQAARQHQRSEMASRTRSPRTPGALSISFVSRTQTPTSPHALTL